MTASIQYRITAASASGLVAQLEADVAAGRLAPGQRLPSVRRLAAAAGISPATVAAGLAELRRRGVVVSEPRRGTRVGARPPLPSSLEIVVPEGVRDLSSGNPDPELLPDLAAALRRCPLPVRLYGEVSELPELVDAARSTLRADGVPAGELGVLGGALDGIERALAAWLRPGDRVAVESPGYAPLFDLLRAHGLGLEPVPVDARGMLPERLDAALARGARAVAVTPRGQNPTGAALDEARAGELRAILASRPEVLLMEDDHLGAVAGTPLHTLAGAGERWAATRSVSKSLGPDLRLAVLAGDDATVARVRGRQACGTGWVSHVIQRLVASLWADPEVTASVRHAAGVYAGRREALLAALRSQGLEAQGASGLNVWLPVREEAATVAALLARGWAVAPGSRYALSGQEGAIRVTTAALDPGDAEVLAADLAAVLAPATAIRSG
jgi:DNA-binding transcriptional MocR family regulator